MDASPGAEGDVGRWLALLRDGSEEEQQRARTELGLILEARGRLDDAAEAYERNVADGVSDRRPYERLAALAQARGDRETEARALRALADLLAPPPPPPPSRPATVIPPVPPTVEAATPAASEAPSATDSTEEPETVEASGPGATVGVLSEETDLPDAESEPEPAVPMVALDLAVAEEAAEESPTTRLVIPSAASDTAGSPSGAVDPAGPAAAVVPAEAEAVPEPAVPSEAALPGSELSGQPEPAQQTRRRARRHEEDDPGVALHHVLEMHPEETRHHAAPRPAAPAVAGMSRPLVTLAMLVPVLVVLAAALFWPGIPNVIEPIPPVGVPTSMVVASPATTIEGRLIAGTPSPLPSPMAAQTPTLVSTPTLMPTPLAARCADAGLRFPESRDPEGAVRTAYREYLTRQGVAVDTSSSLFVGLGEAYAARHEEVVAGWMAVTLQREQRGLTAFPLADYVASDVVVAAGPGEYQLRATISPQGWTELRSWPAETCEGAFMRSPANAHWVDVMQASVGDITWALPTRTPTR